MVLADTGIMRHPKGRKYCSTDEALQQYCYALKSRQCPHCAKAGFLVCHGFLRGYSATGSEQVVRGRRFLCSKRFRRSGCGRTYSVLLSEFIENFVVTAGILWRLLAAIEKGQSVAGAWRARRNFVRKAAIVSGADFRPLKAG